MSNLIGKRVTVYDRYLFAVPVVGIITDVSDKDGAYAVTFDANNPGGKNVIKHNGKFFHHQQCRLDNNSKENTELFNRLLKKQIEILEIQVSDLTLDFISTHEKYLKVLKKRRELELKYNSLREGI